MGEKSVRYRSELMSNRRTRGALGRVSVLAFFGFLVLNNAASAPAATKVAPKAATKKALPTPAPSSTVAPPKTFCDAWASVRDVRASGLTGAAAIRLQAERYQRLVPLAPSEIRPAAAIMAEYFAATLAMADKPLSNAKQAARLEAIIPKIGDALTTVTRHAVRTCPRSLIRPTTTTTPSTVVT